MTQLGTELTIREAIGSDLNFIFDTFRESLRADSALGRSCRAGVFKKEFSKVIDHILEKSKVLIACMTSDPNVILGYLIYEGPNIIHYVFVKRAFRTMGIARALVAQAIGQPLTPEIFCSFKTRTARELFDKFPFLIHNPFINYKKGAAHG